MTRNVAAQAVAHPHDPYSSCDATDFLCTNRRLSAVASAEYMTWPRSRELVAFCSITGVTTRMVQTRSQTLTCATTSGTNSGRVSKRGVKREPTGSPKIEDVPGSGGAVKVEPFQVSVKVPKQENLLADQPEHDHKSGVKRESSLQLQPVGISCPKPSSRGSRAKRATSVQDRAWHAAVAPDIEDAGTLAFRTRDIHERLLSSGISGRSGSSSRRSVLDALISTILSQATTGINQKRAFASLTERFGGDWGRAREAGPDEIEDAIRSAGLANRKAPRIHAILQSVYEEFGEYSLEHLRELDDKSAIAALTKYNGVGPKTASCVLMFNMDRPELPVDTHVNRLSQRLGWTRPGCTPELAYDLLNGVVEPEIKYALHVQLIQHGRRTCKAQRPHCDRCVLNAECPSAKSFTAELEDSAACR